MKATYSNLELVPPIRKHQHDAEGKPLNKHINAVVCCTLLVSFSFLVYRVAHAEADTAKTEHLNSLVSFSESSEWPADENVCIGAYNASTFNIGTLCFCVYTWGTSCMSRLNITVRDTSDEDSYHIKLRACCTDAPLSYTAYSATFFALGTDNQDLLVIPRKNTATISSLKHCPDALPLLTWLLSQGRKDYVKFKVGGHDAPPPEWQCVHLPYYTSVEWLHVHNFMGSIPSQYLPDTPENGAACVLANISNVTQAAEEMLGLVPASVPQPSWWTPPVPYYTELGDACFVESWANELVEHLRH